MIEQETYYTECAECSHRIQMEAAAIDGGFITWRITCPKCGRVQNTLYKGKGARIHQDTVDLQLAIHEVFSVIGPPIGVRQMFYQLSNRKVVDKTEAGAKRVQRAMTAMRRNGSIPYSWVTDNSRMYYQSAQYSGMEAALNETIRCYRRNLWATQNAHVEIWLEKRALVSQLNPVCDEFGVRLYPMAGYTSISFAAEAAMELREIDKPIYIYHLSDLDADGTFSSVVLERELRSHGVAFTFRRLGLTVDQIDEFGLHEALRPQKTTSKRYRYWLNTYGRRQQACELDAVDPRRMRHLVREAITQHIDPWNWNELQKAEAEERRTLEFVRDSLGQR